jgi:heme exporter protein B
VIETPKKASLTTGAVSFLRQAFAVFRKESRVELRTRQAMGATLLFSVVTLCVLAYLLALKAVRLDVDAALLWIVLFFSAMSGLSRVFVREEELGTADTLRLTTRASAVLAGKMLFNWLLLAAIQILVTPLLLTALGATTSNANMGLLLLILFLAGIGLAAASTFVAALVAPASGGGVRSSLFLISAFPVLVPLLLAATSGTLAALSPISEPMGTARNDCVVLASYDTVVIAASFLLFGYIWDVG